PAPGRFTGYTPLDSASPSVSDDVLGAPEEEARDDERKHVDRKAEQRRNHHRLSEKDHDHDDGGQREQTSRHENAFHRATPVEGPGWGCGQTARAIREGRIVFSARGKSKWRKWWWA